MKRLWLSGACAALLCSGAFASGSDEAFRGSIDAARTQAGEAARNSAERLQRPPVLADGFGVEVIAGREAVQGALRALRGRESDGGGVRLVVVYKAIGTPGPQALLESGLAREKGWAINVYTGILSSVFENRQGELCFRMYVVEREGSGGKPAVRTFNTERGEVRQLVVLSPARSNG